MRVITTKSPPEPDQPTVSARPPQPVRRTRTRARHFGLFVSFWLCVAAPVVVYAWYLFARAEDQYASRVGFAVRAQDAQMPVDLFEGLGTMGSANTSDTDILYEFI